LGGELGSHKSALDKHKNVKQKVYDKLKFEGKEKSLFNRTRPSLGGKPEAKEWRDENFDRRCGL
jgi:hypothetical protein